jgi:hypothetical protein
MKTAEGAVFFAWGLCPQTPEIYRLGPTSKGKKNGRRPSRPSFDVGSGAALGLRLRRALSSAQTRQA